MNAKYLVHQMTDYLVPFYDSQIEVTVTKQATIVDHWILQTMHTRRRRLHKLLIEISFPRDFLIDPNNTFVGIGVEGDAEKLLCDHGLYVANTVDLNKLALLTYDEEIYGKMDLKRMAKAVLGKVMMEKQLNNVLSWNAEDLCYEQVEYGAIDDFTSFEIGKELFNILSDRDSRRVKFGKLSSHHQPWLLLKETLRLQNLALGKGVKGLIRTVY
ncbi:PREDICTED: uncharacterized protein LOC109233521 [Nicotiana attenuata]|uniref:uncharacterized protein LOC109233521 n=1 Tax=Nicotiana attenuata TaxID=49451 RepID=UPI000905D3A8|nr:PREDICTED: uncharacterized protein LOC109233521 [Nicotiana attenuata]